MGLYVRHPASFDHDTGSHPESARRLVAIERAMAERDWLGLEVVEAPAAEREQLTRVHSDRLIDSIEELSDRGGGMIDFDTIASAGSYQAALRSAGGAIHAVDRLLGAGGGEGDSVGGADSVGGGADSPDGRNRAGGGQPRFAFCGLRPPGHHAERDRSMGFCLFNNIAVAAAHALAEHRAERVLIFDWDVHHGNGTEAIFSDSAEVLYVSVHQSPLYPGTGPAGEVGRGAGTGYTVNLPVAPGAGGAEFSSLVQHLVVPLIRHWKPRLVCVSAGYDAHRDDPLAQCDLVESDYSAMASALALAAESVGAPILIILEGGYAVDALAASVVATLEALRDPTAPLPAPVEPAAPHLERVARHWPALALC